MKWMDNEKGITLVALVVTMIILTILFTIVFNELIGSSGIVSQIKETATTQNTIIETSQEQINGLKENDKEQLSDGSSLLIQNDERSELELKRIGDNECTVKLNLSGITKNNEIKNIIYTIQVKDNPSESTESTLNSLECSFYGLKNNTEYEVKAEIWLQNNDVYYCPTEGFVQFTTGDLIDKYGYIVNYEISQDENDSPINWRLFYADEEYAYIIMDPYISENISTNISNAYYEYNETVNIFARMLNPTFEDKIGFNNKTNDEIKPIKYLTDQNRWKTYLSENALYAAGCPSFELLAKSYNKKYPEHMMKIKVNEVGYTEYTYNGGNNGPYNIYRIPASGDKSLDFLLSSIGNSGGLLYIGSYSSSKYVGQLESYSGSRNLRPIVCMTRNNLLKYTLTDM